MFDSLAGVVVQGEDLLVADLAPTPNATYWLAVTNKLFHIKSFETECTCGTRGVIARRRVLLLFPLSVQVPVPGLRLGSVFSTKISKAAWSGQV